MARQNTVGVTIISCLRVGFVNLSEDKFNHIFLQTYFRGSHGAIIVYDITNYKSLNNVYNWKSEVEKATSINPFTHIPTVLVGNKVPQYVIVGIDMD